MVVGSVESYMNETEKRFYKQVLWYQKKINIIEDGPTYPWLYSFIEEFDTTPSDINVQSPDP